MTALQWATELFYFQNWSIFILTLLLEVYFKPLGKGVLGFKEADMMKI